MKITNNTKENPLEIIFNLHLLEERYIAKEDFCLTLDLDIFLDDNINQKYSNITIDRHSIEKLISTIKSFVNKSEEQLYYEPLEGDFQIYIPRPPKTKSEIIKELMDKGIGEDTINEVVSMEDTHKLFFVVDTCKYNRGVVTGTGLGCCLQVTDDQLAQFANELAIRYNELKL